MVSHPELSSDPPIGSDRESGCDMYSGYLRYFCNFAYWEHYINLGKLL